MSLHLSRLILNPYSRQVASEITNAYEMHRTIMQAFPYEQDGGPGRVLFRVDADQFAVPMILVQSEKKPDWSFLSTKDYLAKLEDNPAVKICDPRFRKGQRLHFLLRANPTIRKKFEVEGSGKRIGLYKEAEQAEWLQKKAKAGGFDPIAFSIISRGKQISRRDGKQNVHLSVDFTGILEVIDPELFLETIKTGIGSGKGYGFGLLSVATVR